MNNKWIQHGQNVLVAVMNHLVLTAAAVGLISLLEGETPYFPIWAAMLFFPAIYALIRSHVRVFIPFLILHALFPLAILILPVGWLVKVFMFVMAMGYVVWSLNIHYEKKDDDDYMVAPAGAVGVMGAMTLIETLIAKNGWENCYLFMIILYLGLYFITYFVGQYLFLRQVSKTSAGVIPEREIFVSGMRQTVLFTLGSVGILILTANIGWVSYLLSWLWRGVRIVLSALFSLLPNEETTETEGTTDRDSGTIKLPEELTQMEENELVVKLLNILENVVVAVIVIALISVATVVLVKGFDYLRKFFSARWREKAGGEENRVDVRESCSIEKSEKKAAGWFAFLNNRERVRKIFRKKVLKHKGNIVGKRSVETLEYMTASECCRKLPEEQEMSARLAKLYEKARYSEEEITGEEVRRVRTGIRQE